MTGRMLVVAASVASLLLAVVYLVAGGGSYEPTPVADPCAPRDWRSPEGIEDAAQQFFLSALDGAACELGVSRESLAVALASEESRQEFAAEQGIDDAELEAAIRAGVTRAIDDAVNAGALNPLVADGLRAVAGRLPIEETIALIEGAGSIFEDGGGILDDVEGLLNQADDLLP